MNENLLINAIKNLNWDEFKKIFQLDKNGLLFNSCKNGLEDYFQVAGYFSERFDMVFELSCDILKNKNESKVFNILKDILNKEDEYIKVKYHNLLTKKEDTCNIQDISIIVSYEDNDFASDMEEAGEQFCHMVNQNLMMFKFDKSWIDEEFIKEYLIKIAYASNLKDTVNMTDITLSQAIEDTNKSILNYLSSKIKITICNRYVYDLYHRQTYPDAFRNAETTSLEEAWENGEYMRLYFKDGKLTTHIF